jgi:serine phosphatase RsbU (regulator of sigma subunit)
MSLALMQPAASRLAWLSIGNVSGLLLRADRSATPAREHLLLRGGVVGYRIPPLRTFNERLDPGDTLLLVSDGIRSGFVEELPLALPPQQLADHILAHHNRQTDDATVLVARRQR